MKTIVIPLAYGDIYDGAGSGTLIEPPDGSISRFDAATRNLPQDDRTLIVCGAGYCRDWPSAPQRDRQVSLSDQLYRYVREHRPGWLHRLFTKSVCWSTRNEVRVGVKMAREARFVRGNERVTVILSSNLAHLLRIRLYAHMYVPRDWNVRLVRARHHFSLRSHVLEPLKLARDVAYALRVHRRLRRRK